MSDPATNIIAFAGASSRQALVDAGGGGPHDPTMEQRVAVLEADMKEIKADLKALRVDTAYIKGRLDSMPTTIQLLGFVIAIFVAAGITRFIGF